MPRFNESTLLVSQNFSVNSWPLPGNAMEIKINELGERGGGHEGFVISQAVQFSFPASVSWSGERKFHPTAWPRRPLVRVKKDMFVCCCVVNSMEWKMGAQGAGGHVPKTPRSSQ
jgi:hypothetical protein